MTITINKLGETLLSDLIESVIYDIDRIKKADISINMSSWINKNECSVCLGGAAILGFMSDKYLKELPNMQEAMEIIDNNRDEELDNMKRLFDDLRKKNCIYAYEIERISTSDGNLSSTIITKWMDTVAIFVDGLLDEEAIKQLKKKLKILVKMLRKGGC